MRYLLAPYLEKPTRTIDRSDLERLLRETVEEEEPVTLRRPRVQNSPKAREGAS